MPRAAPQDATPLHALRLALPGLSPRLRQVGRFVAGHDFDAATRSMRDLAAAAGVNPAGFTRLAQALGYAGWDALRDALIEARRPALSDPFTARARATATGPEAVAAAMLLADADALRRTDATAVAGAARAVHDAARIWVAGFRSCRSVAVLLHYELRLFRPDTVRLVGGTGPEDLDHGGFAPGDVVVLTGFAPYSRASVGTARAARQAQCRLIALTDTPRAPMAEGADHLLLFEAASGPGFFPSLTGAFALAQALAAATFGLGGDAALTRLRATETRLAEHSQYTPEPQGLHR